MITIYKYPLQITDSQSIEIPACHKILDIQFQESQLVLWALVNPNFVKLLKHIYIFGTGQPIEHYSNPSMFTDTYQYLKTIQQNGFVWHIFV